MTDRELEHRIGRAVLVALRETMRAEIRRALDEMESQRRRYVYFMRSASSGLIKIGISYDPESRRIQVCRDIGEDVDIVSVLVGDKDEEAELHRRFTMSRVVGEWFILTPDLQSIIDAALQWDVENARPVRGWP